MGTLEASCLWALLMSFSFGVDPGSFFSAPPSASITPTTAPEHPRLRPGPSCDPAPHICCLPQVSSSRFLGDLMEASNKPKTIPSSSKHHVWHLNATFGTDVNQLRPCPPPSWVFYCFPAVVHPSFPFPYFFPQLLPSSNPCALLSAAGERPRLLSSQTSCLLQRTPIILPFHCPPSASSLPILKDAPF